MQALFCLIRLQMLNVVDAPCTEMVQNGDRSQAILRQMVDTAPRYRPVMRETRSVPEDHHYKYLIFGLLRRKQITIGFVATQGVIMVKHRIGTKVRVRRSKFLGTPSCIATIVSLHNQGYNVVEIGAAHNTQNEFQICHNHYVLVGPPLHGKLVAAP